MANAPIEAFHIANTVIDDDDFNQCSPSYERERCLKKMIKNQNEGRSKLDEPLMNILVDLL